MKSLALTAALLISSSLSFAQSSLILNTGKVLTIDKTGTVYDFGNFLLPYKVKVMGGRFIIDEDRKHRTVDSQGFFYNKDKEDKVPAKIEVVGDNYFISKRGLIYTIDDNGFMYEGKKERELRKVEKRGGNFFISEKKEKGKKFLVLFVVNQQGVLSELKVPNLELSNVELTGGRYFTTYNGELFTVSEDGFVFSKRDMGRFNGSELKKGGNFFVFRNVLYTITDSGVLVNAGSISRFGSIKTLGTNFFITHNNALFTIGNDGLVKAAPVSDGVSAISLVPQLW